MLEALARTAAVLRPQVQEHVAGKPSQRGLVWCTATELDVGASRCGMHPGRSIAHHDFHTSVFVCKEESGGHVAFVENTVPAGWAGPPLHHHDFDEAFYVLDGELTFALGDARSRDARASRLTPRNVPHTLAERTGGAPLPARLHARRVGTYFDRLAAEHAGVEPPPQALGPIPETIVVGPPISDGSAPASPPPPPRPPPPPPPPPSRPMTSRREFSHRERWTKRDEHRR